MNVLHSVSSLSPEMGGLTYAVVGLCNALAENGASIRLVSLRKNMASIVPLSGQINSIAITRKPNFDFWVPRFTKKLHSLTNERKPDLVHVHGLWEPTNYLTVRFALNHKLPLVISTHGMLEPWARNHKFLKKKAAWHLYQRRLLVQADLLHATSFMEANNLRKMNLTQPIAVVPNGLEWPQTSPKNCEVDTNTQRTILFLSRVHPVKGLLNLVQAMREVPQLEQWRVVIAGSSVDGYQAKVEAAIEQADLSDVFVFVGAVNGAAKWDLYRQADLFVLPTFSENFGIVVAEALATGLPVITTWRAPWQELVTHNCGWWIDIGVDPLVQALTEAMSLDDATRQKMGCNGRQLVKQKYQWPIIAENMTAVYDWLLLGGRRPDCVV